MIPFERRKQMLQALEQTETVTIEDFGRLLANVSESTIRRDLKVLAEEGEIVLLRGGAAKLRAGSHEISFDSRNVLNIKEKEQIARFAAGLVSDGEVIYLDAGSTALRMMKYIKNKNITIVTTNALIVTAMENVKGKCIIVGGDLFVATGSLVGPQTDKVLKDMFFDKAFLGATAFSVHAGVTTPDNREASKKQIVKMNAKESYILADSSKAGKNSMCKAFDLKDAMIICDKYTPELAECKRYMIAD